MTALFTLTTTLAGVPTRSSTRLEAARAKKTTTLSRAAKQPRATREPRLFSRATPPILLRQK